MQKLIIIRGLPGSGKSTYAKTHFPGAVHLEADMYFCKDGEYKFDPKELGKAHAWCQTSTKNALSYGRGVVVTNTFIEKWEFVKYLTMADDLCIPIEIIELQTQFGSIHGVPPEKIETMRNRWDSIEDMPLVQYMIENGYATYTVIK